MLGMYVLYRSCRVRLFFSKKLLASVRASGLYVVRVPTCLSLPFSQDACTLPVSGSLQAIVPVLNLGIRSLALGLGDGSLEV